MLLMSASFANAQDIYDIQGKNDVQNEEKELSRQERKALQQRIDSVQWTDALEALNDTVFTLEADQVIFKYGERAYVSPSTNFVAVNKNKGTVQVAFNIPAVGPNGMGGVTLDGTVSGYKISSDKSGNITYANMNVMGTAISAQLYITLYKGTNKAQIDIEPTFNSHRISLSGVLLPKAQSFVVKGTSI